MVHPIVSRVEIILRYFTISRKLVWGDWVGLSPNSRSYTLTERVGLATNDLSEGRFSHPTVLVDSSERELEVRAAQSMT